MYSSDCVALEWTNDGDVLAIAQSGNTIVYLWTASSQEIVIFPANLTLSRNQVPYF